MEGVRVVSILLLAKLVEEFAERQRNFQTRRLSLSVKSTLVTAVFRKSLRSCMIVNYMSVDVEEVANFVIILHNLWIMPIQILIALAILFRLVGLSTLAGLATMILLSAHLVETTSVLDQDKGDLHALISIKMQAWTDWFLSQVDKARQAEQVTSATSIFFLWLSPLAVSVATFSMCVLVRRVLIAALMFTTFRILQDPLRAFLAGAQAVTSLALP